MEGELDPFDYVLAEHLHMTVEELYDRMPNQEFLRWRAFFNYRRAMTELEIAKRTSREGLRRGR